MPAGSLQVGTGGQSLANPPFAQQGQVDWVAFGNTVYSASLSVMQRLAGAGVQPITQGGGLALGTRFKLGDVGRRRMDGALQNLRGVSGFDDIIYYGFGLQSLVNTFAETQAGVNCIALCSCLADMHSEAIAARILSALWRAEAFPEEFEPSHSQFLRLIKTCSGVVLGTTFGYTADVILGDLGQYHRGENFKGHVSAAAVRDIAKALQGLFKLSNELGWMDGFEETMQKSAAASFQDAFKCVEETANCLKKLCKCDLLQDRDTNIQLSILGLESTYESEWTVWLGALHGDYYAPRLLGISLGPDLHVAWAGSGSK
ncbi:hypothetical protein GP486_005550, partial [Trichoglossum hirsutum]